MSIKQTPDFCTQHTVHIYDRGARQRIGTLSQVVKVRWARDRDDMSFADVTVEMADSTCQKLLRDVEPNRHELVIYEGQNRVWEGPISLAQLTDDGGFIEARDVMYYVFRTASRAGRRSRPAESVVARAKALLVTELARKEAMSPRIHVVDNIVSFETPSDAKTVKYTRPYETTVYDDIDSMAMRAGLDYTVVGRSILLFDTHTNWGQTRAVTQDDFLDRLIVTKYGLEGATHAFATSFEGLVGAAAANGNDPYYGEWEVIDGAYNEEGTEAPTQDALNSQADRNLNGRNPVPMLIRAPQNATLSPTSSLRIEDLVPGIRIPITIASLNLTQLQKLDSMKVTETPEGTTVQVAMSAASATDVIVED